MTIPILLAAALLALAGCTASRTAPPSSSTASSTGGSSSSARPSQGQGSPTPTPSPSPAATSRYLLPRGTPRNLLSDLDVPWSIAFVDASTALIAERDSARILEYRGGRVREVGRVDAARPSGEGGLLGLAVRGRDLCAYASTESDNRVIRYRLTGSAGGLRLGEATTMLDGIPRSSNHNGGRLKFGPDGMLYVTTGDGGTRSRSQDLDSLGGKILRIAADGSIPKDNPFPNSPVWTLGHRNVQGIGWTASGKMFASEFGQDTWDELNVIVKGKNYGWPVVEGKAGDSRFVDPVQQWPTDDASPSGLAVLEGSVFTANLRGEVLRAIPVATPGNAREFYDGKYGRLRDVVVAPDRALWILTNNTDGRGSPQAGDDHLLRVSLAAS